MKLVCVLVIFHIIMEILVQALFKVKVIGSHSVIALYNGFCCAASGS